jgi:hypothetical protein
LAVADKVLVLLEEPSSFKATIEYKPFVAIDMGQQASFAAEADKRHFN